MTDGEGLPTPRRHLAMVTLLATVAMAVIDGATLNVALPTIARALGVAPDRIIWVVTGYQVALLTSLLAFSSLGEIYGYRRVFTAGVILFLVGSIVCAGARSFPALLLARTAQGFACAAIFGVSTALVRFTQPRAHLGRTIGNVALLVAVSLAMGPMIGAAILAVADWWCIFLLNVPMGLLALTFFKSLPDITPNPRVFDWMSAGVSGLVLGLLIIGLGNLVSSPLSGGGAIVTAVVAGGLLVRRELKQKAPLVPVDLMKSRTFAAAVSASTCCFAAQICAFIGLPFYLQNDLSLDKLHAGLLLTAWPAAVAVTAPFAGRLADHFPASVLCAAGAGALALGLLSLAAHPTDAGFAYLFATTIVAGIGFGSFQTPNNRAMLLSAPLERSGAAGGMQATARQFGQAAGAALVALAFTAPRHQASIAFLIGSGLAASAAAISLLRSTPGTR